ncbi:MAG TPA: hypothetical protein VK480_10590 [Solirubrobacterales bacterium]|nr:hypothetical protein [Solirubrobacterales bacterium]
MNLRVLAIALLTVAFAALGATAASATVIVSNGALYTGTIEAESEGSTTLDGPTSITCSNSTVKGSVESHGNSVTAEGAISTLTFTSCNQHVTVEAKGSLIVHEIGNSNGTLTSNGAAVKVVITSLGMTCEYSTSNTDIGTLTGSTTTGGNATLDIDSSSIPRTGGSFFCGSSAEWTGSYKVTSPSNLRAEGQTWH